MSGIACKIGGGCGKRSFGCYNGVVIAHNGSDTLYILGDSDTFESFPAASDNYRVVSNGGASMVCVFSDDLELFSGIYWCGTKISDDIYGQVATSPSYPMYPDMNDYCHGYTAVLDLTPTGLRGRLFYRGTLIDTTLQMDVNSYYYTVFTALSTPQYSPAAYCMLPEVVLRTPANSYGFRDGEPLFSVPFSASSVTFFTIEDDLWFFRLSGGSSQAVVVGGTVYDGYTSNVSVSNATIYRYGSAVKTVILPHSNQTDYLLLHYDKSVYPFSAAGTVKALARGYSETNGTVVSIYDSTATLIATTDTSKVLLEMGDLIAVETSRYLFTTESHYVYLQGYSSFTIYNSIDGSVVANIDHIAFIYTGSTNRHSLLEIGKGFVYNPAVLSDTTNQWNISNTANYIDLDYQLSGNGNVVYYTNNNASVSGLDHEVGLIIKLGNSVFLDGVLVATQSGNFPSFSSDAAAIVDGKTYITLRGDYNWNSIVVLRIGQTPDMVYCNSYVLGRYYLTQQSSSLRILYDKDLNETYRWTNSQSTYPLYGIEGANFWVGNDLYLDGVFAFTLPSDANNSMLLSVGLIRSVNSTRGVTYFNLTGQPVATYSTVNTSITSFELTCNGMTYVIDKLAVRTPENINAVNFIVLTNGNAAASYQTTNTQGTDPYCCLFGIYLADVSVFYMTNLNRIVYSASCCLSQYYYLNVYEVYSIISKEEQYTIYLADGSTVELPLEGFPVISSLYASCCTNEEYFRAISILKDVDIATDINKNELWIYTSTRGILKYDYGSLELLS
jgi:hypothetical protein